MHINMLVWLKSLRLRVKLLQQVYAELDTEAPQIPSSKQSKKLVTITPSDGVHLFAKPVQRKWIQLNTQ